MSEEPPDGTPGWDAIDAALRPIYGTQEPKHYGTLIKFSLGGPDPLDGISAYKRADGPPHWHFVSYGLTELYFKESDDPKTSGYGFELTFRLACKPDDEEPPVWALNVLQNLARYVFESGNVFAPGHHMTLNGPIALEESTDLTAVLFVVDPELPEIGSPHGRLRFVQLVGITGDELEAVQGWNSDGFTELMAASNRLLVTDLGRRSILADAAIARTVAERTEREGSSLGYLYLATVRWERKGFFGKGVRLTLDTLGAAGVIRQLRGRLLHERDLILKGKGGEAANAIRFIPGEKPSIDIDREGFLTVALSPALAREMTESLRPQRGTYRWEALKDFELVVLPTEIKDKDGNVLRVEG